MYMWTWQPQHAFRTRNLRLRSAVADLKWLCACSMTWLSGLDQVLSLPKGCVPVISEAKNQFVELILVVQPNPSSPELETSFLSLARGVPAKHHVNGGKSAHNMRNMWNGTHVKGGCPLEKDLLLFATPSIFSWIYRYGPVKTLAPLVHLCPSIGTVNPITWSSFSWKCCPRKLQPKLVTTQLPPSVSICEPPQPLIDNWSKSKV